MLDERVTQFRAWLREGRPYRLDVAAAGGGISVQVLIGVAEVEVMPVRVGDLTPRQRLVLITGQPQAYVLAAVAAAERDSAACF